MPIITFRKIYNFHKFSNETAKNIIYDELIPLCESLGIKLSFYGNHESNDSYENIDEYEKYKKTQTLFNITKIQEAFKYINEIIKFHSDYHLSPLSLQYVIKEFKSNDKCNFISPGDLIVAMLLNGYSAKFSQTSIYCYFNAFYKKKFFNKIINNCKSNFDYNMNLTQILSNN